MARSLWASRAEDPRHQHAARVAALRRAVWEGEGSVDSAMRVAIGRGDELSKPVGPYVELVRDRSYRITDADLATLTAAGRSDDEIFEITVAAALGAALNRLDAGLRALRGEQ
jgi:hypothetical protein